MVAKASSFLLPADMWPRITLLAVVVQVLLIIALELYIVIEHLSQISGLTSAQQMASLPMIVYHIIFISSQVFLLGIAWDALLQKNTIQIIASVLFDWGCLVYGIIQFYGHSTLAMDMETSPASTSSNTTMPSMNTTMPDMNHTAMMRRVMAINMTVNMTDEMGKEIFIQDMKPYEISIITSLALFSLLLTFLAYKLYKHFGWAIYKDLGADIEIRRMYQNHLCLLTLLKLDIFFFVGYAIQLITLMPGGGSNSIIEFTIAIPISVLMLVFGFRGLHKENKVAMAIFLTACVLSGPYFILRFVQIFSPVPPGALDPYSNSRKFLTFFISTTVFLLIVTLGYSIVQFKNFGHGLRKAREEAKTKHADQRPLEHVAVEVDAEERDLGSSKIEETRWTID